MDQNPYEAPAEDPQLRPPSQPQSADAPPLARWLTLPGRLLLLVTVVSWAAGFIHYLLKSLPDLPAGRYPLMIWFVPMALGAFLFFRVAAYVLQRLGVRIYQHNSTQDTRQRLSNRDD